MDVDRLYREHRPDVGSHLAGIGANRDKLGGYFHASMAMGFTSGCATARSQEVRAGRHHLFLSEVHVRPVQGRGCLNRRLLESVEIECGHFGDRNDLPVIGRRRNSLRRLQILFRGKEQLHDPVEEVYSTGAREPDDRSVLFPLKTLCAVLPKLRQVRRHRGAGSYRK